MSTSPCGDARLNSPYEITTDCKKKNLPLLFPFCMGFSFSVVSPHLFLCFQKVFHLKVENTTGCVVCLCLCNQCSVPCAGVLGKSELGKAVGGCFMCLRLSGSDRKYSPNILLFLLGNATPAVNKCFARGPHDQRDP